MEVAGEALLRRLHEASLYDDVRIQLGLPITISIDLEKNYTRTPCCFKIEYRTSGLELHLDPFDAIPNSKRFLEFMESKVNKDLTNLKSLPLFVRQFFSSRYYSDFLELGALGCGGYGGVFKSMNLTDGMIYAVKKIPFDEELEKERFLREAQAMSRIQHPYIIRYYTSWIEDAEMFDNPLGSTEEGFPDVSSSDETTKPTNRTLFIQMELCSSTLAEKMKKFVDKETAWVYFWQMVEGLCHIHDKGFIHRDLSRDNIFIDVAGNIKIGDLGLAVSVVPGDAADTLIESSTSAGNPTYRAPEMRKNPVCVCQNTDVYQLGLILFEMLNPTTTESERLRAFEDVKRSSFPEHLVNDERAVLLINRLLVEDPTRRPSSFELLKLRGQQFGKRVEDL